MGRHKERDSRTKMGVVRGEGRRKKKSNRKVHKKPDPSQGLTPPTPFPGHLWARRMAQGQPALAMGFSEGLGMKSQDISGPQYL